MARKAAANIDPQAKPPEPAPEINEPVEVVIEPDSETGVAVETVAQPEETTSTGVEKVDEKKADTSPAPSPQEDPEKVTLRQRLQEMENADRLNKQAIEEANRKVREANQQRSESARREFDAQMDSINNSIGAANSIIESAATELEAAGNAGDWKAVAEINTRAARAASQLERLEYQKGLMEQRLEQAKRGGQTQTSFHTQPSQQQPSRQQQPQPQRPMTAEEVISNAPIPDRAKNWLRQHPEYVTDQAKNRLVQSAHDIAAHKAGGEFNDAYFEHLESTLGIQKHAKNGSAGAPLVSAPPTRETPSMTTGTAPRSNKVTLTPAMREVAAQIANSRGISQAEAEQIYARELDKINKVKKGE